MNNTHRKTLAAVFADPINGALEWRRIEALLIAAGCSVTQGSGSSATFEKGGLRVHFHRPTQAVMRCSTACAMREFF